MNLTEVEVEAVRMVRRELEAICPNFATIELAGRPDGKELTFHARLGNRNAIVKVRRSEVPATTRRTAATIAVTLTMRLGLTGLALENMADQFLVHYTANHDI